MRLIFLALIIFAGILFSQTTTDFFPHEVGNIWEYVDYQSWGGPIDTFQVKIFRDSLDADGNLHIFMRRRDVNPPSAWSEWEDEYIIDTLNQVWGKYYEYIAIDTALIYKLNGQVGDTWIIKDFGSPTYERILGEIEEINYQIVFGINRLTMKTIYYLSDTAGTFHLDISGNILADKIGLILIGRYENDVLTTLKGAVINGILYGDTTYVGINSKKKNLPILSELILYENYPNPFNSTTKFSFKVNKAQKITLKIYDITGKEVIRLIDRKKYFPGNYVITWNGKDQKGGDLSSGIYLYILHGENSHIVKKLIITK